MENVTVRKGSDTEKILSPQQQQLGIACSSGSQVRKGKAINTNGALKQYFITSLQLGWKLKTSNVILLCTGCWCSKSSGHHKLRIMVEGVIIYLRLYMINQLINVPMLGLASTCVCSVPWGPVWNKHSWSVLASRHRHVNLQSVNLQLVNW